MQITCPSCAAAYAVPEEKLTGRAVKCARCGTQWTPVAEPTPIAPPSDPPSAPQEAAKQDTPLEKTVPQTGRADAVSPKPLFPNHVSADLPAETWSGTNQPLFGTQWPQAGVGPSPDLFSDRPSHYQAQEPQPRSKALIVAWVASIALLGAVVIAGVVNRADIMEAWPPSQRVYAVFGLR